ncbi:hypothetical protein QSE00_05095 [Arenibacter sp. M-2]|uniref:hypothetical protein n=1 Tax=Arenibacter sp. M-2 TaxID=3053612 RepID=UPI002570D0A5|nr:hypothetical protein [Arenibacter sp. M-2]MDL5511179.1 hypothetical protein [Arenibacter sp. M-2]
MSNLNNIQRKISEGVSGWLLFEFHCFRGLLFSEKYLSYPIGQILNSITDFKTQAEINHPLGNGGQGRPLQVDFVLSEKAEWKYAVESKWIGHSTISLASLIWDLIRLQNLFSSHSNLKCYFLLAGFDKKIETLFSEIDIYYNKESNKKNEITKISQSKLTFNLNKLDSTTKKYVNEKISKYPKFKLYSKISCKPAHKYPNSETYNMSFSTYTFEVLKPDETLKIKEL